jgi:flavin-dependent thymidylate synthase
VITLIALNNKGMCFMQVGSNNSVQLLGFYGGDQRTCLSAWQSTTDELKIDLPENISDRIPFIFKHLATQKKKTPLQLLNSLADNNHGTPFEKSILDFQLSADLASHIHSLKHRISSINAESARYKEFLLDKYYIPSDWKYLKCSNTIFADDSYGDEFASYGGDWQSILKDYTELGFRLYHQAIKDLEPTLGRKRAKESARYFLGYNTQLNYDWQMNFRSFVNIQQLRNDDHAQLEIHQITNTMLYLVENIPGNPFKGCLESFDLKSDENYVLYV